MDRRSWRWLDVPIVIVGGALVGMLAGLAATALLGTRAGDPHVLFWVVVPVQNLGHIGTLALIGRMRGHRGLGPALGLVVEPRQIRWVAAGAASLFPLVYLTGALRSLMGVEDDSLQAIVEAAAEVGGTVTMAAVVVGVVVMGPVAEELLYRGLVVRIALQNGAAPRSAAAISAAVFAVAHLADPSLFSRAGAATLVALFVLGFFLGVLRIRTGGLGAPIFAHSGFNLMTLVILFFFA